MTSVLCFGPLFCAVSVFPQTVSIDHTNGRGEDAVRHRADKQPLLVLTPNAFHYFADPRAQKTRDPQMSHLEAREGPRAGSNPGGDSKVSLPIERVPGSPNPADFNRDI